MTLDRLVHPKHPHAWTRAGIALIIIAFLIGVYRIEGLIESQQKDVDQQTRAIAEFHRAFQVSRTASIVRQRRECNTLKVIRLQGQAILTTQRITPSNRDQVLRILNQIDHISAKDCA